LDVAVKAQRTTELLHAVRGVLALTEHGFDTRGNFWAKQT